MRKKSYRISLQLYAKMPYILAFTHSLFLTLALMDIFQEVQTNFQEINQNPSKFDEIIEKAPFVCMFFMFTGFFFAM